MPKYRYQEVADDLRSRIQSGEYPAGSKLPSRSELCEQYGISQIVADKAMMILKLDGWTDSLPGVGVYVSESHPEE